MFGSAWNIGVMPAYPPPQSNSKSKPEPNSAALKKRAAWLIWSGLALALPITAAIVVATNELASDPPDLVVWAVVLMRVVGGIMLGFGMADWAERKGYARAYGWLCLLFLLGLLIVALLPDQKRGGGGAGSPAPPA